MKKKLILLLSLLVSSLLYAEPPFQDKIQKITFDNIKEDKILHVWIEWYNQNSVPKIMLGISQETEITNDNYIYLSELNMIPLYGKNKQTIKQREDNISAYICHFRVEKSLINKTFLTDLDNRKPYSLEKVFHYYKPNYEPM